MALRALRVRGAPVGRRRLEPAGTRAAALLAFPALRPPAAAVAARRQALHSTTSHTGPAHEFPSALLSRYVPRSLLGQGAFGDVYRADVRAGVRYPPSLAGRGTVAIKVMSRERCPYATLECELLGSVDHANVLKLLEVVETPETVYLVTEELRGPELFQVLVDRDGPFHEEQVLVFAEQMLVAVEACHKKNFAHLDVKVENMVFRDADLSSPLVLVDFGAAERFVRAPYADKSKHYIEGLDDETRELPPRPMGTIPYSSPEVMNGFFSSRSDVWSVGVSLFVLLTGRRPFESMRQGLEAEKSVVRQIKLHGGSHSRPATDLPLPPDVASPPVLDFLHQLTRGHPANRLSATEALEALRKLPRPHLHLQLRQGGGGPAHHAAVAARGRVV